MFDIRGIAEVYQITKTFVPGGVAEGVFKNPHQISLLAYSPLGWAMQHSNPTMPFISVYVLENWRRRGVGTSLVRALMRHPDFEPASYYSIEAQGFFKRFIED